MPQNIILNVIKGTPKKEKSEPLILLTQNGKVACQHFDVPDASRAVLWVGGINNSRGTPVEALYTNAFKNGFIGKWVFDLIPVGKFWGLTIGIGIFNFLKTLKSRKSKGI